MLNGAGSASKLSLPEHKECEACKGSGVVPESLAHEMVCDPCGGAGRVNAETGEALDLSIVLILSIRKYQQSRRTIKRMAEELNALNAEKEYDFEPHGELKKMRGGLYRMD